MIEWLAIGLVAFLLFFLSNTLTPEHVLLRILTIIFGLLFIVLLGKVALENKNYCDVVVQNQTITGNTTSFNYQYFCADNSKNTFATSFKLILSYFFVFLIYVFIYFNKEIFDWIRERMGRDL